MVDGEASSNIVNAITGCAVFTDAKGKRVHVLFDIEAVMAVERLSGRSVFDLLSGRPGPTDMVNLLLAGTQGYARRNGGAVKALNPQRAARFVIDSGGVLPMLPTMLESLTKAEGLGLDLDDDEDDDEGADLGDDAGPPGRGATS